MKFKTISEKINESKATDLFKCYLAVKRSSGQRWWSYKGFAGDKFFIQITEHNVKKVDLNPELPILNYHGDIVELMLDNGCKLDNVYNKPETIKKSGSKKEFHKVIGDDENLPKTAYTQDDAVKIGFPIIAKPKSGHSGIGIQIFKNKEDFDKADHSKFDVYSEFVDKKSEHRFFNFKGKPICWLERKPMNDRAKTGEGKNDDEMKFKYIKHSVDNTPEKYKKLIAKYSKLMKDFPYICFDIMEDKSGKLFIIESNAQPGVPFDVTVEIYKSMFEDFYGRPVNSETMKLLDEYAEQMNRKTLEREPDRFEIKD